MISDDSEGNAAAGRPAGPTGPLLVERTYLSLSSPADFRPGRPPRRAARLHGLPPDALAEWRRLYAAVGARWQWHDRDAWPDDALAAYLARPEVAAWRVAVKPESPGDEAPTPREPGPSDPRDPSALDHAGLLELCAHPDGSVEIVYFGLIDAVHGAGLGAWLLGEAVQLAFARGATRVWLHTCTLDGPAALPNYLARGFRVDRRETYEVARE